MRILLVGGHLAPAIAVIDSMPEGAEIIFVGRKSTFEGDNSSSLEYEVMKKRRIEFIPLTTGRLQRKLTTHTIKSILKIPYGLSQAIFILKKHKPDAVISFGGYLSVPIGLVAYILKIPLIIHEQILNAGIANRFLSFFATKICISWSQSMKFFPRKKTELTGIPIRKFRIQNSGFRIPHGHLPLIYITGGSAGAHAINELIEGCLENLLKKFMLVHQTGDSKEYQDYSRLNTLAKTFPGKLQKRYIIQKFIDPSDVGSIMDKATLIISRAGINTITEILKFGKPCLLIPLPYGQKNEQLENAQFVKKTGLGEFMMQQKIDSVKLLDLVEKIITNINQYTVHSRDAKLLIKTDAAEKIVKILYEAAIKTK